jgi:ketosteroid isomerase-like protein
MSETTAERNVAVVRRGYEAFFGRRDLEAAMELGVEDVELHSAFGEGRVYRGREGIERFLADIDEVWEEFQPQVEELTPVGDETVLAVLRFVGRARLSGMEVEQRFATVWTLREGKLVKAVAHLDVDEARRAADPPPTDVVRRNIQAWVDGDEALAAETFHPEVVLDISALPDGSVLHGLEGAREFFRRWRGAWTEYEYEIEEMIQLGERVVVLVHERGRGKGSGVMTEGRIGGLWTVRGGRVVHLKTFTSAREARVAAGLPPE